MQEIMVGNKHIALLKEHQDGQRVELWHLESSRIHQGLAAAPGGGTVALGHGVTHTALPKAAQPAAHTAALQSHFIPRYL